MLDVGWPELIVIGAVALVAVGPKDLPKVMHTVGVFAGKARRALIAIQHDFDRLSFEAERLEKEKAARAAQPPFAPPQEPPPSADKNIDQNEPGN